MSACLWSSLEGLTRKRDLCWLYISRFVARELRFNEDYVLYSQETKMNGSTKVNTMRDDSDDGGGSTRW